MKKMEAFKIHVEVSVDLSANTQNFLRTLFSSNPNNIVTCCTSKAPAPCGFAAVEETPATVSAAATESQALSEKSTTETIGIEDVRKILAEKVNKHRDTIKQKLVEFGAPSVTKLSSSKYEEMYDFLKAL